MPTIAKVEPLTSARTLRGPFDYALPAELGPVEVGSLLVVPFGRRRVLGVVVELAREASVDPGRLVAPLEALELGVPTELVRLAQWLAAEYCSTPARALRLVLPPGSSVRPPRRRPRPPREPAVALGARPSVPKRLTSAQEQALAAIEAGDGGRFLLHGVTGSGKTEVYLRATAAALTTGKGAIVLVPEIALTPQIVGRFESRLGDTVAVLHSQLTEAERHREWLRLRLGEARVCIGPRSAVFAPIAELGLIVIDEEHDSSYKHEGDPRYDARRVAERRAGECGATLIAGSATPRPESYLSLQVLELPERVDARALPPVEVLDMRGRAGPLHPDTRQALAQVARDGGKAIVLLNRRGWSNFLECRSCGRVWECPQCDVALVLHRAQGALACHHCGHREAAPDVCDGCGSVSVARHGSGTERLESELQGMGSPVFRLDSDVRAGMQVLHEFDAAPAGVLVGTQMVAKGHDFPEVTLGVVLDADSTLRFPDFRAEERTFALIAQLAGRVGRGPKGGHVLVQTLAPEAPAIGLASRHDACGFLVAELARREALRYPPFSDLVRIVCSAPDAEGARAAAGAVAGLIDAPQATVLGPAPLFRLRGRARSQVVVKAGRRDRALVVIGDAVDAVARDRRHRRATFSVDVDPQ